MSSYTWEELQNKIHWLPQERIVPTDYAMVKKGKNLTFDKGKYKELYLQALCDRTTTAIEELKRQYELWELRKKQRMGR